MTTIAMARSAAVVAAALLACGRSPETPKTIARAGTGATLLGASDGRVFWVRGFTVSWWDAAGGKTRDLEVEGAGWATSAGAAVDDRGLFFVHHDRLEHLQTPRQGTRVFVQSRKAGEHANGVVRDGDCAFVLDGNVECRGHGTIVGIPLVDDETCPGLTVPANGMQPLAFVGNAHRFFWSDSGCVERRAVPTGIFRVDRATGQSTIVAPDEWAQDLELGARGLYWRSAAGIRRASVDGPPGAVTVVAGAIHGLVVDGGFIHYAADDGLHWVPEEGGRDRVVAATAGVRQFVLDARHLYWITPADDVVRAPRPH